MAFSVEILTLFPDYFTSPLSSSLLGKASEAGRVAFRATDIRDFATDKHRKADDLTRRAFC